MMRFSPKNSLIAWSVIGLIIIVALIWVDLLYLPHKIDQNNNQIIDSRVNIELNNRQKLNLANLTKQLEQIKTSSVQLDKAFFDRTQALKFVEYIEGLANQLGVEQDLKLTEPSRSPNASTTSFYLEEKSYSLSLTGKTENLLNFLKSFESNDAYVVISSLSLQETDKNNSSLSLTGIIPWH
jgi:Tfp pilus assembly protein PilO